MIKLLLEVSPSVKFVGVFKRWVVSAFGKLIILRREKPKSRYKVGNEEGNKEEIVEAQMEKRIGKRK